MSVRARDSRPYSATTFGHPDPSGRRRLLRVAGAPQDRVPQIFVDTATRVGVANRDLPSTASSGSPGSEAPSARGTERRHDLAGEALQQVVVDRRTGGDDDAGGADVEVGADLVLDLVRRAGEHRNGGALVDHQPGTEARHRSRERDIADVD